MRYAGAMQLITELLFIAIADGRKSLDNPYYEKAIKTAAHLKMRHDLA